MEEINPFENLNTPNKLPNFGVLETPEDEDDLEDYQKISTNKTKRGPAKKNKKVGESEIKIQTDVNSEIRFDKGEELEFQEQNQNVKTMGGPYGGFDLENEPDQVFQNENDEHIVPYLNQVLVGDEKYTKFADRFDVFSKKADSSSSKSIFTGYNREVVKVGGEYSFKNDHDYVSNRYRVRKWK